MDTDKQELIAEVASAALEELGKFELRQIQAGSPREILKEVFKGMIDPQPAENNFTPIQRLPEIPPEFPKLLVSYATQEWCIVENFSEWAPIHHFYVRRMSELPALKESGMRERPKQEFERRKQGKG